MNKSDLGKLTKSQMVKKIVKVNEKDKHLNQRQDQF